MEIKVIDNAQKGLFLNFKQIFFNNTRIKYTYPFSGYISPII